MKRFLIVFMIGALILVNSCSTHSIDDYAGSSPELNLREFFDGQLVAYGMVRERSGKMIRYFQATIEASWDNGVGTLDETFWFNDGEVQKRVWTLTPKANGEYIGVAGDVIGEARIALSGNAMNIRYQLDVPWKDSSIAISMDDWLYQVSPNVIMNETAMSKWGFSVGKVTLVIMKAGVATEVPGLLGRQ